MGDERSDTSSIWPRDELDFVNELQLGHEVPHEDSVVGKEREEAVSAALSVVVASARHGVVTLCASIAHIIRAKIRMQQRVEDLEKKLAALEKSSTTDVSETYQCTCPSHIIDSHSLLESPTSQRCGSAPPSFVVNPQKLPRGDNQSGGRCYPSCDPRSDNKCCNCQQIHHPETRTSSVAIHDNNSSTFHKTGERKVPFLRGTSYASTRSLSIGRSTPPSNFMRKKYSTISLRRVRRTGRSKNGAFGMCSSSNSHGSSSNSLEHRGSTSGTSSRSCIVTVAEVYAAPEPSLTSVNTESDTVRLLARKLTNVLQGSEAQLEDSLHDAHPCSSSISDATVPEATTCEQLCAPYPLAGCECVVCSHLASDPKCHLYVLSTNEGSLLPRGSRVLVQGDQIGTVVYLGHRKHPLRNSGISQHHLQASAASSVNQRVIAEAADGSAKNIIDEIVGSLDVSTVGPLGVTITLWPPDHGQIFVPLGDVLCQLDEESDIDSGLDLEYVDDVNNIEEFNQPCSSDTREAANGKFIQLPALQQPDLPLTSEVYGEEGIARSAAAKLRTPKESHVRSPSISSDYSDSIHEDGDLCQFSLENENLNTCGRFSVRVPEQEARTRYETSRSHDNHLHPSSTGHGNVIEVEEDLQILHHNTALMTGNEGVIYSESESTESRVSLYDTSDSAISLTFTQKLQGAGETSEPQSLSDFDKDSLHFGDTWDSGCCMGSRERCRCNSSEQCSDIEYESNHRGSVWARNLSEALDSVWEKHKNIKDICSDSCDIIRERKLSKQEAKQRENSKHLQLFLENGDTTPSLSFRFDNSLTEHTEV